MKQINGEAGRIIKTLHDAGFAAYLVGGSVRDLLIGSLPAEWDITTSAKPAEVSRLFKKVVPTGIAYGTVTVLMPEGQFEVTTFRADEHYVDGRHPANVVFTGDIHQDLARRDFTVNALAYDPETKELIDDFSGQADLKAGIIRSVGSPIERFSEDGLRPLRACRLAAKLGFKIEKETFNAISRTLKIFQKIAPERVHDEILKLLSTGKPSIGFELMRQSGLLKLTLPELEACFGVKQPPEFHPYDVYWHSLYACDAAPKNNSIVRLATLLHDIGKPPCQVDMTFYAHDQKGAEMAESLLRRLKFSNADIESICNLIINHMFDYTPNWGDPAVRRFIKRVGNVGNTANLFLLRRADTQAMHQKTGPDYLGELQNRIDKVIAEENALHVTGLKIDGRDIMKTLELPPGPKVGQALNTLLEKVLDDPKLNERETLLKLLGKLEI